MTTAAERLARISRYPLTRKPGPVAVPAVEPADIWQFVAWHQQVVHDADPTNFEHLADDACYLPKSPAADWIRAEIASERAARRGGAGRG